MAEWKKRKDIKGVSASTIVDLKSVLATTEQDAKRFKSMGEKMPKPVASKKTQELYAQNKGVQQRAQLDEEVDQEEEKNWDNAEAKLRVKTELYNNMVRGGVLQPEDDDDSTYLVDFERKTWEQGDNDTEDRNSTFYSYDMDREDVRKRWEDDAQAELRALDQKKERIKMAEQLDSETKRGRRQHLEMKQKRQRELQQRLKLIKEKEIKKKLGASATEDQPSTMYDPEADADEQPQEEDNHKADVETQQQQNIERAINGLFRSVKQGMIQ